MVVLGKSEHEGRCRGTDREAGSVCVCVCVCVCVSISQSAAHLIVCTAHLKKSKLELLCVKSPHCQYAFDFSYDLMKIIRQ